MNLPDGWLAEEEVVYLAQLVWDVSGLDGLFLEVGSWHGRSTVAIGKEVKKLNSYLYCIDIWNKKLTGKEEIERREIMKGYGSMSWRIKSKFFKGNPYRIFAKNIETSGLNGIVVPIVGLSSAIRKTWEKPLRFIFIDGNHEPRYVRDDSQWRHLLVSGGIIAFHDYRGGGGVKRPVDEEMDNDPDFEAIGSVRSIKAFRRKYYE